MSTILIIEDSLTLLNMASQILKEEGHSILTAIDGERAIAQAIEFQPDLILLDVVLPGFNGYQVCRMLKSQPETADIPVIMLTSKNGDRDREWGMAQGAEDYITKPISQDTLLEAVRRIVPEHSV
jgi:twitching motility two-component system response regulator PilH